MKKSFRKIIGIALVLFLPVAGTFLAVCFPLTAILANNGTPSYWQMTCKMFKS